MMTCLARLRYIALVVLAVAASATSFSQDAASSMLAEIRKQDSLAENGYYRLGFKDDLNGRRWTGEVEVTYNGLDFNAKQLNGNLTVSDWRQGKYGLSSSEKGSATIEDQPRSFRKDPWGAPLCLGPQFVEGRGLSVCTQGKVERLPDGWVFTGRYNSMGVRAILDPTHKALATKIDFYVPGGTRMYAEYLNNSPARDKNGFCYARRSMLSAGALHTSFEFTKLETGLHELVKPKWDATGTTVFDDRNNYHIAYSWDRLLKLNGGVVPSLDRLLEISASQGKLLDGLRAQDEKHVQAVLAKRAVERTRKVLVTLGIAVVLIGFLFFSRRILSGQS